MKADLIRESTSVDQNPNVLNSQQNSLSGALRGCLGNLDAACIEKLLLHCASALERNDVTLAQQVMWVLNNVASSTGDPNQRLTSYFLRALVSRATRVCPTAMNYFDTATCGGIQRRLMSVTELAGYVDLIPWHRFGFCVSNSAIFKAVEGCHRVHILDFSITHCMQWPTLIDALAKRPEGPPSLCITVPSWRPPVPPSLNVSIEEVGMRLANFAKFRDVPFEFKVIEFSSSSMLNLKTLNLIRDDEALVINCQNWLRYLLDEENEMINASSYRDSFLEIVKDLNPRMVVVVDEDSDMNSPSLCSRITTGFNYLWIPFDALETFLPKESRQRIEYEADMGHKIENIVGFEGIQRIERLESGMKLSQRMKKVGFGSVGFDEETVREVKSLLDEHASGWGMKKDEDDVLVLTWKGHNSVYATAWVPNISG
ncbi:scarecrow-like protein 32 [Impatiens glandulifera]|uniref:scarecrow-like protein 32 n=1 Tax=Impatiens glandulifera TaxID=253017 RepID=UPI001FB04B70|nr:scarecrow-like protein 32 [Impatiens glandulifera]